MLYSAFSVVILSLVGGMLLSSVTAQKSITTRSTATTTGQLISQSIDSGVRNSLAITPSADGKMLAITVMGAPACQAWLFQDGAVYFQQSASAISQTLTSGQWMLLGTGVSPTVGDAIFLADSDSVALSFSVSVSGGSPVKFNSTATNRQSDSESLVCMA